MGPRCSLLLMPRRSPDMPVSLRIGPTSRLSLRIFPPPHTCAEPLATRGRVPHPRDLRPAPRLRIGAPSPRAPSHHHARSLCPPIFSVLLFSPHLVPPHARALSLGPPPAAVATATGGADPPRPHRFWQAGRDLPQTGGFRAWKHPSPVDLPPLAPRPTRPRAALSRFPRSPLIATAPARREQVASRGFKRGRQLFVSHRGRSLGLLWDAQARTAASPPRGRKMMRTMS